SLFFPHLPIFVFVDHLSPVSSLLTGPLRRQKAKDSVYRTVVLVLSICLPPRDKHLDGVCSYRRRIWRTEERGCSGASVLRLAVGVAADEIPLTELNRRGTQGIALARRTQIDEILGRADKKVVLSNSL